MLLRLLIACFFSSTFAHAQKVTIKGSKVTIKGATTTISPSQGPNIPAPQLWLKANVQTYSDLGTTPANDGDLVEQWNDQSVTGANVTQTTSANRPTFKANQVNSLPAVKFNATSAILANTSTNCGMSNTALTVFAVVNAPGGTAVYFSIGNGASNSGISPLGQRNTTFAGADNSVAWVQIKSGGNNVTFTPLNAWFIYEATYDGTTLTQYKNGTLLGSVAYAFSAPTAYLTVGNDPTSDPSNSYIAEVVGYSTVLSTADRQKVEKYLNGKYAIY